MTKEHAEVISKLFLKQLEDVIDETPWPNAKSFDRPTVERQAQKSGARAAVEGLLMTLDLFGAFTHPT